MEVDNTDIIKKKRPFFLHIKNAELFNKTVGSANVRKSTRK